MDELLLAMPVRLDVFVSLTEWWKGSRRERQARAVEKIQDGSVLVNGAKGSSPSMLVYPEEDDVRLDDRRVVRRVVGAVWAYHKPTKTISDMKVLSAAVRKFEGVDETDLPMPIGQLDVDTTGLMLFTDDGALSMLVNLPGNVTKTYLVECDARDDIDVTTKVATLQSLDDVLFVSLKRKEPLEEPRRPVDCIPKSRFVFEIAINVGTFHVVKRKFFAVGLAVRALCRVAVASLFLDVLFPPHGGTPGSSRRLDPSHVDALWDAVGGKAFLFQRKLTHLHDRSRATTDPRLLRYLREVEQHLLPSSSVSQRPPSV